MADVKALILGCLARERLSPDPAATKRMIAIACARTAASVATLDGGEPLLT